jgi:hypothetical protein
MFFGSLAAGTRTIKFIGHAKHQKSFLPFIYEGWGKYKIRIQGSCFFWCSV